MLTLNPETLASLAEFMSPAELRDFLGRVHAEWRASWPVLQAQLHAQEWLAAQKQAHRLKGALGSVGCEALYDALNDLENALREMPPRAPSAPDLARLSDVARDVEQAFTQAVKP